MALRHEKREKKKEKGAGGGGKSHRYEASRLRFWANGCFVLRIWGLTGFQGKPQH